MERLAWPRDSGVRRGRGPVVLLRTCGYDKTSKSWSTTVCWTAKMIDFVGGLVYQGASILLGGARGGRRRWCLRRCDASDDTPALSAIACSSTRGRSRPPPRTPSRSASGTLTGTARRWASATLSRPRPRRRAASSTSAPPGRSTPRSSAYQGLRPQVDVHMDIEHGLPGVGAVPRELVEAPRDGRNPRGVPVEPPDVVVGRPLGCMGSGVRPGTAVQL